MYLSVFSENFPHNHSEKLQNLILKNLFISPGKAFVMNNQLNSALSAMLRNIFYSPYLNL